jgi:hypothetical protein
MRHSESTNKKFIFSSEVETVIFEKSKFPGRLVMGTGDGALTDTIMVKASLGEIETFFLDQLDEAPEMQPAEFRKVVCQKFECERAGRFMPFLGSQEKVSRAVETTL